MQNITNTRTNLKSNDNRIRDESWDDLVLQNLSQYVHNRVGSHLRDLEVNYIKLDDTSKQFRKGELVIQEEASRVYIILLFIKKIDDGRCECLKNPQKSEKITINIADIYHYSEFETIKQDIKPGEPNMGQDNILERYII